MFVCSRLINVLSFTTLTWLGFTHFYICSIYIRLFTRVRDFEFTAVCSLFDLLQIPLYHGWVVDPHNQAQCRAVGRLTYNQLAEKVINDRASPDKEKSWNGWYCSLEGLKLFHLVFQIDIGFISKKVLVRCIR